MEYSSVPNTNTQYWNMHLDILTPETEFYAGEAQGVKLPGVDGSFEILNDHAPIISALGKGVIRVNGAKGNQFIRINSGFVECQKNNITVLVEGATEVKDETGRHTLDGEELGVI